MPRNLKDPTVKDLPPAIEYLSHLDLKRVADAILATENGRPMTEEDFADCKRMVWEAAEHWLPADIYDLQIIGVEVPYEKLVALPSAGEQRTKAVLDIVAVVRGRLNSTEKYAGKKVIVDWKTTSNLTLDAKWKARYTESWQGPIYTLIEPAELVNFRGITRGEEEADRDPAKPVSKFADLFLHFPPETTVDKTLNHMAGVSLQRKALIDAGLTIWPQNRPHACGAYGRDCPYKTTCPGEPGLVPKDKSFSYSSMGNFMLCPERYRRGVLESLASPGETIDGSEESAFGNSFHRGMAELYRQVMETFCN